MYRQDYKCFALLCSVEQAVVTLLHKLVPEANNCIPFLTPSNSFA